MLFSELQEITQGDLFLNGDVAIRRFATDSRTLSGALDEVFVASKGKRDGHDYIQSAIKQGVRNFIVEQPFTFDGCNVLLVKDSIIAFQKIASNHRSKFEIPVVAITGSNGKTTVKEWLSTILSEKYFVIKNPKSYNSQVGVPIAVMEIKRNHEVGIFEAGISKTREMVNLEKMIQPTLGIFTTLGPAHDDGFESSVQKLTEKLKLFERADQVICRSDTSFFPQIKRTFHGKLTTWSLDSSGDMDVSWDEGVIEIDGYSFQTNFSGETDLENVTHAVVASLALGLFPSEIQSGLKLLKSVPMRLELKKGINGCYVLDDSYNNDLEGLKVALDYLQTHRQNDKRTLILSDILQSGLSDQALYREVSELVCEKQVSRLVGVGPRISSCREQFAEDALFFSSTEEMLESFPAFEDEMIVVKGARDFALERIVKALEEKSHGTVLEVNFESLQHNFNQYRNLLSPKTKVMVMVKANAYGSGILEVANFLQHKHVDYLGVAYVDEAIQLRKNGVNIPIMIMNPHIDSFSEFERYNLEAEIFSIGHLRRMLRDTINAPAIHIKIDTGMHRLGFSIPQLPELTELLRTNPQLEVSSIFTHFASADKAADDDFTRSQAQVFEQAYEQLCGALGYRPIRHVCNSSGVLRWPDYHFEMVRLGIGLHGFDPTGILKLRTTRKLKSVISQIQVLKKGETVGYSRNGIMEKDSTIAVVPIGYEDGYLRVFGNRNASILVNGSLCPAVGNICMDMTMIDITGVEAKEGDEVIIFGEEPSIEQLGEWANTIPYEILTNVSSRVKRVFISE